MTVDSTRVPLALLDVPRWAPDRRAEPVTVGVPLPLGAARSTADLRLVGDDGFVHPLQVRALDAWPDGSIRWALLDFTADVSSGTLAPLDVLVGPSASAAPAARHSLAVRETPDGVDVDTGPATFAFRRGKAFPVSSVSVGGIAVLDPEASGLRMAIDDTTLELVVDHIEVRDRGPLRADLLVHAVARGGSALPLAVFARVELFAGTATIRTAITVRNTRRARHPGGIWALGDPGSLLLTSVVLHVGILDDPARVRFTAEPFQAESVAEGTLEIYQESSGGDAWRHRTHVNRRGEVPLTFRGYRTRTHDIERAGHRASPIVVLESGRTSVGVAVPQFWQNFPKALDVVGRRVTIGLFPRQFPDVHELQGGEQKTHLVCLSFAPDDVSDPPMAWCHQPLRIQTTWDWNCRSEAVPFLTPARDDDERYRGLVDLALDENAGFFAKRERADEFGWRHFGDLPADHESAFQPPDQPFVSHYNNQYDAVAAFAVHVLRSGDARWWTLMDDLARHVRDIDVYHTTEDKAAYNGGLFWHTQHYVDAGTSTHRTYPPGTGGGGPSNEHNYATGLMLHYFLTGDEASRDAAVGLARWVIAMDDGRLTPFRWLASGPTGLASATGSMAYHGPGRGAANSILACLVAARLTGDGVFREKADELVRRCIHPADDLEARNLLDVERRWYYTVFLQAIGTYLHEKDERGEHDAMFQYARASLLHYAHWMVDHEVPYLSRPEKLEFPTETWAAQDLRKAHVLWSAARHARLAARPRLIERAEFFFQSSIATLLAAPTRIFTRPVILVLVHAPAHAVPALSRGDRVAQPSGPLPAFRPQREQAVRVAFGVMSVGLAALVAVLLAVLVF